MIFLDARTATDHFPGIGRYVVNLARVLHAQQADLGLHLISDPTVTHQRLTLPAEVPCVPCAVSPFALAQQWRVPALLREQRATLYHSAYYLMPFWVGVPTLLTVYDLIPLLYPHYFTAPQRLVFYTAHLLALRVARVVLAISEATKRDVRRVFGVPAHKIVVTPLAADPQFYPRPAAEVNALRQQYGLPDDYLLYVGSNKPHKNLARLVQAYLQLPNDAPQLVIGGHWDARYPEARQRAGENPRIKFVGPLPDAHLPALYSGARLFVFPSEYEGFGLPVLEALACGAPVVCSNTSSLPEVAGDAALTCDPTQVAAIQTALNTALNRSALTEARQQALARAAQFSWGRVAEQTAQVYRQTLGRL